MTAVEQVGDEEMVLDYAMNDERLRNDMLQQLLRSSQDLHKKLNALQEKKDFDALAATST